MVAHRTMVFFFLVQRETDGKIVALTVIFVSLTYEISFIIIEKKEETKEHFSNGKS